MDDVSFTASSLAEWTLPFMAAVHRGKKLPEGQKANSNLNFKMLSVQVFAGVGLGTFHLFLLILM